MELSVYARRFHAGGVQDADGIECRRIRERSIRVRILEKVLVSLHHSTEPESFVIFGEKKLGFHLRVDGLREDVVECQPKDEGTQVVHVRDCPESIEVSISRQSYFLSTLAQQLGTGTGTDCNSPIDYSEIVQIEV